jgi:nucleotide-binding universal stress UspA family protein
VILLGHPETGSPQDFQRIIEKVARNAPCQVVVIRFAGLLHTERILVPIAGSSELLTVADVLKALSKIGRHRITLLWMLASHADGNEGEKTKRWLTEWSLANDLGPYVLCRALPVESRLETILEWSVKHDLLLMAASPHAQGIQRIFFGSLASDVAQNCRKPLIMVHAPKKKGTENL